MLKKLNRMWLSGLKKAGKAQQKQASKVLKAILTKPKAKRVPSGTASRKPVTPKPLAQRETAPGEWLSSSCVSAGLPAHRMHYRLFLPSGAPGPGAAIPLIVMLHGCEQNAADFAAGTRMNQLAAAKGYAVLYPEQSLRTHPNRCWKWYDAATQRGGGDIATIVQIIDKIVAQYAIDHTRIYVCGISAGAAMAQILALTHPQLIAAVGMHSGPVFGVSRTAVGAYGVMQHGSNHALAPIEKLLAKTPDFPRMPAILITGDDDKIVRPVNQLQLAGQLLLLNHAAGMAPLPPVTKVFGRTSKQFPRKNSMTTRDFATGAKVLVRSVHIARLGHAWSGGDEAYPFNAKGPDAGKLMLAFFSRHRRKQ
jgi:poly(hydroxyalkanoate) depolymerase family esterase